MSGEKGVAERTARRCPACGHLTAAAPCHRCGGRLRDLDEGRPLPARRGAALLDLLRGLHLSWRAVLQVVHRPEFVGRIGLPVAANLLAFGGLCTALLLGLRPAAAALLAGDGPLPAALQPADPELAGLRLSLVTLWWLWPTLLETALGPLLEPLVDAVERRMGGTGLAEPRGSWGEISARGRETARVLAVQLATLPALWALALLPWFGLPLALLLAAGAAAVAWFALPAHRRGVPLRLRLLLLRRNWPLALGVGLGCQLSSMVPVLNLLVLAPAAAVAATAAYFRFDKADGDS